MTCQTRSGGAAIAVSTVTPGPSERRNWGRTWASSPTPCWGGVGTGGTGSKSRTRPPNRSRSCPQWPSRPHRIRPPNQSRLCPQHRLPSLPPSPRGQRAAAAAANTNLHLVGASALSAVRSAAKNSASPGLRGPSSPRSQAGAAVAAATNLNLAGASALGAMRSAAANSASRPTAVVTRKQPRKGPSARCRRPNVSRSSKAHSSDRTESELAAEHERRVAEFVARYDLRQRSRRPVALLTARKKVDERCL
jgi:hypothetical protein